MPISIGFVGAGGMNRVHIKAAQTVGLNLAGVADVSLPHAESAQKEYGVRRAYADYRELLADQELEAVVIGTPNKFHAEQAIMALQAGKHVFLEKPMAMNLAEADAILAARDASGKLVQMGMVNRFRNPVQALKKFIDAGRCGTLYAGQTWWYRRRGIPGFGGWFTTKSMSGGGALIDIGVHLLDLAVYLMGFPKPVAVSGATYNNWKKLDDYAYTSMWGAPVPGGTKDVDDYALATIRFDGGQTLQLNVSWALHIEQMNPESGMRLMGDKGGVHLKGFGDPHVYSDAHGYVVEIQPAVAENDPNVDQIRHFAECIAGNAQPMPTAEQGRTIQAILDAIYRSGDERREIRLDE